MKQFFVAKGDVRTASVLEVGMRNADHRWYALAARAVIKRFDVKLAALQCVLGIDGTCSGLFQTHEIVSPFVCADDLRHLNGLCDDRPLPDPSNFLTRVPRIIRMRGFL